MGRCREMQKAAAIGNGSNPYRLIRNTDPRERSANEVIKESDGTAIHCQDRRLTLWKNNLRSSLVGPRQQWTFQFCLQMNQGIRIPAIYTKRR